MYSTGTVVMMPSQGPSLTLFSIQAISRADFIETCTVYCILGTCPTNGGACMRSPVIPLVSDKLNEKRCDAVVGDYGVTVTSLESGPSHWTAI